MTAGWVYKIVQAGVAGLFVFIMIRLVSQELLKWKRMKDKNKPTPGSLPIKGKEPEQPKDAEYKELDNDTQTPRRPNSV